MLQALAGILGAVVGIATFLAVLPRRRSTRRRLVSLPALAAEPIVVIDEESPVSRTQMLQVIPPAVVISPVIILSGSPEMTQPLLRHAHAVT